MSLKKIIKCEKHGDITGTEFRINYVDNSSGRKILKKKIYCLECITEMLDKMNMPKVTSIEIEDDNISNNEENSN